MDLTLNHETDNADTNSEKEVHIGNVKAAGVGKMTSNHKEETPLSNVHFKSNKGNNKNNKNKKSKRKMDRLHLLTVNIDKERQQHLLSHIHCKWNFFWITFVPSILLTLTCGVLAAIDAAENDAQNFNIAITILAMVGTLWQSVGKQLDFSSRADQHVTAAIIMKKLLAEIKVYNSTHDDDDHMSAEEDIFIEKVIEKFDQAVNSCNAIISTQIESAFSMLRDNLSLKLDPPFDHGDHDDFRTSLDTVRIYQMAFNCLFYAITSSPSFPMRLPESDAVVLKAIKDIEQQLIEEKLKEDQTMLQLLHDRKQYHDSFENGNNQGGANNDANHHQTGRHGQRKRSFFARVSSIWTYNRRNTHEELNVNPFSSSFHQHRMSLPSYSSSKRTEMTSIPPAFRNLENKVSWDGTALPHVEEIKEEVPTTNDTEAPPSSSTVTRNSASEQMGKGQYQQEESTSTPIIQNVNKETIM